MFALKICKVSGKCLSKLTQSPPDLGRKMDMSARYLVIVVVFPSKTETRCERVASFRRRGQWLNGGRIALPPVFGLGPEGGRPCVIFDFFFLNSFHILFPFPLSPFFFCSLSWCETWRRRSSGKLMLRGIPASRLEHLLLGEDLAFKFSLSEVFLLMAKFKGDGNWHRIVMFYAAYTCWYKKKCVLVCFVQ